MKKALAAVWLLVLLLVLNGCTKATPAVKSAPSRDAPIVVGFSQVGTESNWRNTNTASVTQALSEEKGYRLLFDDAQQLHDKQLRAIRDFIRQRVDYIVVAPVAEQGWDDVLAEAREAGIPVIIMDRMVEVQDEDLFTCWIGANAERESAQAVLWMESQFDGTPLRIAHLQGTLGSTTQLGRTAALEESLAMHPEWTLACRGSGNFTRNQGQELIRGLLRDGGEVDLIFAENDDMAYGAIDALEEAGLKPGEDVVILSFGGSLHALTLVMEGKINYVVECSPLHGPRIEAIIQQLEVGEAPPKYTYVDGTTFDQASVTQELLDSREY